MTTGNSAVVKIIAQKTKEYNDLDTTYKKLGNKFIFLKKRYDTLMEIHEKTLRNEYNLTGELKEQRLEMVEDLKTIKKATPVNINKYIKKWEGKK